MKTIVAILIFGLNTFLYSMHDTDSSTLNGSQPSAQPATPTAVQPLALPTHRFDDSRDSSTNRPQSPAKKIAATLKKNKPETVDETTALNAWRVASRKSADEVDRMKVKHRKAIAGAVAAELKRLELDDPSTYTMLKEHIDQQSPK